LENKRLIEVIPDDFGPTILAITDNFYNLWTDIREDKQYPFYKYGSIEFGVG
jgi:hypothetical protein